MQCIEIEKKKKRLKSAFFHEEPYFSQTSKEVIKTGMVLTDEPGIYIEGKYGVRIEDDILITDTGCELLTLAPKELIVI